LADLKAARKRQFRYNLVPVNYRTSLHLQGKTASWWEWQIIFLGCCWDLIHTAS